jgi:hypothetical protein
MSPFLLRSLNILWRNAGFDEWLGNSLSFHGEGRTKSWEVLMRAKHLKLERIFHAQCVHFVQHYIRDHQSNCLVYWEEGL